MSTEETPEMLAALGLHGTAETPGAPAKPKRKPSKAAAAKAAAEAEAEAAAQAAAAAGGDQTMVGNPGVVDPPPPGTDAPAPEAPVTEWAGSPGSAKREG